MTNYQAVNLTHYQIDFHILKKNKTDYLLFLAKLIEKIFQKKIEAFVFTSSAQESKEIEEYLWVFNNTSFLPHHIIEDNPHPAPILISHQKLPAHKAVLINLSPTVPIFYKEFMRTIEIVYEDEIIKKHSRLKYKHYQQEGANPRIFNERGK